MTDTSDSKQEENKSDHAHSISTDTTVKKKTVLEGHGYYLGNPIGSGTYATVKVNLYTKPTDRHLIIRIFLNLLQTRLPGARRITVTLPLKS